MSPQARRVARSARRYRRALPAVLAAAATLDREHEEASPSPVYGARLLSGFGASTPSRVQIPPPPRPKGPRPAGAGAPCRGQVKSLGREDRCAGAQRCPPGRRRRRGPALASSRCGPASPSRRRDSSPQRVARCLAPQHRWRAGPAQGTRRRPRRPVAVSRRGPGSHRVRRRKRAAAGWPAGLPAVPARRLQRGPRVGSLRAAGCRASWTTASPRSRSWPAATGRAGRPCRCSSSSPSSSSRSRAATAGTGSGSGTTSSVRYLAAARRQRRVAPARTSSRAGRASSTRCKRSRSGCASPTSASRWTRNGRSARARPPVSVFGSTTGAVIDERRGYLDGIVRANDLPQKVLVVHQLNPSIVRGSRRSAGATASWSSRAWTASGVPARRSALGSASSGPAPPVHPGFKLFFDEDTATAVKLMTPGEVLGLRPRPEYVLYE